MSARIIPGRSWTSKIRLPEEHTTLDVSSPVGAAAVGATVRILNSARTMEDIGNVLAVSSAVSTTDQNSTAPVTVGTKEYTYLVDGDGVEHKVADPNKVAIFINNVMKVTKVEEEDITG